MNSLQKFLFLFVAALLLVSTVWGQTHDNLRHFSAKEDGSYTVIIEWEVVDSEVISDYVLERSLSGSSSDFQNFNIRCIQSGRSYRCEDTELYKGSTEETAATGSVSYRLKVTHTDGTPHVYFQTDTVEYTTNAVRRTWGSIKSMFQ